MLIRKLPTLALMLTSSLSCQAGINVHTTMGTFTPAAEAAGPLDFTENLDSGSKVGSIITLTDVSITGNDIAFFPNGNDTNKVDGTGYLRFRVDNSSTLTFTFNAPVTAFGFEVNPRVQGVNDVLLVNIDGVDSSIAMPTTDTTEFRGLVSTTPFTSVMFSNSGSADDFYGIDNLIAYAVPEPSAYACITGILMFSCVLLRRQRPR